MILTEQRLARWALAVGLSAGCADAPRAEDAAADAETVADASDTDGGARDATSDSDSASDEDAAPLGDAAPLFQVSLIESRAASVSGWTAIATAGAVREPEQVETLRVGDCALLAAEVLPFCDPACEPGTICLADDVCGAPPVPLGAGDIRVDGLSVDLTLHPETQYFYYAATFAPEPVDGLLFTAGAAVTATAEGGNVPAFTVASEGVAPLASTLACPPDLAGDGAVTVQWTASGDELARVRFELASGNHGSQFARIACEAPDRRGALTIDRALLDAWLASPRPYTLARLERRRAGAVPVVGPDGPGLVVLSLSSQIDCRW